MLLPPSAAVAGLPAPGCNMGTPIEGIFRQPDPARSANANDQAKHLLCELDPACDLTSGTRAHTARSLLETRRATALAAAAGGRWFRVGGLIALLIVLALYFKPRPAASWLAPLMIISSYAGFLYARGYRLTFSKMPEQEDFLLDGAIGGLIATALTLALLWLWKKRRDADVVVLVGTFVPWLCVAAWSGASTSHVAPPYAGLAVFLLGPSVIAGALSASILSLAQAMSVTQAVSVTQSQ